MSAPGHGERNFMSRLSDTLGSLFRRSPRLGNGAPAAPPIQVHVDHPADQTGSTSATNGSAHPLTPRPAGSPRGLLSRLPGAKRDAAIAELRHGYDQVLDLMQVVRQHLQDQSERSERMLRLMERVPEALSTLPQQTANQTVLIETISTALEQQGRQSRHLSEALNHVAEASEHQGQVLGLIQDQLEQGRATDQQSLRSMDAMNQTLIQLSQTNHASAQTLAMVSEQSERSTQQVAALLQRSQHQLAVLTIASWVIAATALGVALYAVIAL
jgi:phosphoglycolate phosphatase-like HAD superfamily hydrolase